MTQEIYRNAIPVVVVLQPVVDSDGKIGIVLVQRAIAPFIGGWALPGGYQEEENWRDTGKREMEEEGTDCIDAKQLEPYRPFPYESTPDGKRILLFCIAPVIQENNLPPFVPNSETSARRIIWEPEESCFSIHTSAIEAFFKDVSKTQK